jgi:hypothetical protein
MQSQLPAGLCVGQMVREELPARSCLSTLSAPAEPFKHALTEKAEAGEWPAHPGPFVGF